MHLHLLNGIFHVIQNLRAKWLTNSLFILVISFFVASGIFVYFFLAGLKTLAFSMSIDSTHSINRAIYTSIPDVSPEKSFIKEIEERILFLSKELFGDSVASSFWYHESGQFHLNPMQEMKDIPIVNLTLKNDSGKETLFLASVRSSWKLEDFVKMVEGKMPSVEIGLLESLGELNSEREAQRSGKAWWEAASYQRHVLIETIIPENIANNMGIKIGQVFDISGLRGLTDEFSFEVVGFFDSEKDKNLHVFGDVQSILFDPILNSHSEETIPFIINPVAATLLPESLSNRPILKPTGNKSVFVTVKDYKNHVTLQEGEFPQINRENLEKGTIEAVFGSDFKKLYDVKVGDTLFVMPYLDSEWLKVQLVGELKQTNPMEPYWRWGAKSFFDPFPLVTNNPPPLALLVEKENFISTLGEFYPSYLGTSMFRLPLSKEPLKTLTINSIKTKYKLFNEKIEQIYPGKLMFSGMVNVLNDLEDILNLSMVIYKWILIGSGVSVVLFLFVLILISNQRDQNNLQLLRIRGASDFFVAKFLIQSNVFIIVFASIIGIVFGYLASYLLLTVPILRIGDNWHKFSFDITLLPIVFVASFAFLLFCLMSLYSYYNDKTNHSEMILKTKILTVGLFQKYFIDVLFILFTILILYQFILRGIAANNEAINILEIPTLFTFLPAMILVSGSFIAIRVMTVFGNGFTKHGTLIDFVLFFVFILFLGVMVWEIIVNANYSINFLFITLICFIIGLGYPFFRINHFIGRCLLLAPLLISFVLLYFGINSSLIIRVVAFLTLFYFVIFIISVIWDLIFRSNTTKKLQMPTWIFMPIIRVIRDKQTYSMFLPIFILIIGTVYLGFSMGEVLQNSSIQSQLFKVGSDIRISQIPDHISVSDVDSKISTMPGVLDSSYAFRTKGINSSLGFGNYEILVADPSWIKEGFFYRDDFSVDTLDTIMNRVNTTALEQTLFIPTESISIGIKAGLNQFNVPVELSIGLLDRNDQRHVLTIGEFKQNQIKKISVPIDKKIILPAEILGIYVKTRGGIIGFEQELLINDVFYITKNGDEKSLNIMQDFLHWRPLITSYDFGEDSVDLLKINDGITNNTILQYRYKIPKDSVSQKGILNLGGSQEVAIMIDESTLLEYKLSKEDNLVLDFNGRLFPAKIKDVAKYFPTLGLKQARFFFVDSKSLKNYFLRAFPHFNFTYNEIFFNILEKEGSRVTKKMREEFGDILIIDSIYDQPQMSLGNISKEPVLISGLVFLTVFTSILGSIFLILLFALFFVKRWVDFSKEIALGRSLGIEKFQIWKNILLELLFVGSISVFIGILLGHFNSKILVNYFWILLQQNSSYIPSQVNISGFIIGILILSILLIIILFSVLVFMLLSRKTLKEAFIEWGI